MTPSPKPQSARMAWLVAIISLFAWTPAVRYAFVWDDDIILLSNSHFNPPTWSTLAYYWSHPFWNLYAPMTATVFTAVAKLSYLFTTPPQLPPISFSPRQHFVSHPRGRGIVFLLHRIFHHAKAAAAGAILFAIHPIQTEAVAFIGALNNPMCGAFSLIAICGYLKWVDPTPEKTPRRHRPILWATAALLAALLSKPTAIVIPPIAILLDWAAYQRNWRNTLRSALPWIAIVIPFALAHHHDPARLRRRRPSVVPPDSRRRRRRILYRKNCIPLESRRRLRSKSGVASSASAGVFHLAAPSISAGHRLVFATKNSRPDRSLSHFPDHTTPQLRPHPLRFSAMVHHRRPLRLSRHDRRFSGLRLCHKTPRKIPTFALLFIFLIIQQHQLSFWQNEETLFQRTLAINPQSWSSWGNLSHYYLTERRYPEAALAAQHSLALHPDSEIAWENLGLSLTAMHQYPEAAQAFQNGVHLDPGNPTALLNCADSLRRAHQWNEAIRIYSLLLREHPEMPEAQAGLALAKLHSDTDR